MATNKLRVVFYEKVSIGEIALAIGRFAFAVGVMLAIIGGIWGGVAEPTKKGIIADLLIAGGFIGLINLSTKKVTPIVAAFGVTIIINIWVYSPAFDAVTSLSQGLAENVIGVSVAFALLLAPAALITGVAVAFRTIFAEDQVILYSESKPALDIEPLPKTIDDGSPIVPCCEVLTALNRSRDNLRTFEILGLPDESLFPPRAGWIG